MRYQCTIDIVGVSWCALRHEAAPVNCERSTRVWDRITWDAPNPNPETLSAISGKWLDANDRHEVEGQWTSILSLTRQLLVRCSWFTVPLWSTFSCAFFFPLWNFLLWFSGFIGNSFFRGSDTSLTHALITSSGNTNTNWSWGSWVYKHIDTSH